MSLYKKLDTTTTTTPTLLTETEGLAVFNALITGASVNEVKHSLFLPSDKIKALEQKMISLRSIMERLVKGQEVETEEVFHFDEETGEKVIDTAKVFYTVPTSIASLKSTCLTVVNAGANYGHISTIFTVADVNDLIESLNYVIEQMVTQSNATNNATFAWWKAKQVEE